MKDQSASTKSSNKKLYRSTENRLLTGVFGGLGVFVGVDPTILRLAWVFITVFTGFVPGVVFYIIAALIIPEK